MLLKEKIRVCWKSQFYCMISLLLQSEAFYETMLIIIFIIILQNNHCLSLNVDSVKYALKGLEFKHPLVIKSDILTQIKWAKKSFQDSEYVGFKSLMKNNEICGIHLSDNVKAVFEDEKFAVLMVLSEMVIDKVIQQMDCKINQEVYILNNNTLEIVETYNINDYKIERKIGEITHYGYMNWTLPKRLDIRRKDFHGIHFKGMTDVYGNWISINDSFSKSAPYFSNNGTYKVTNHISGILIRIMDIMKSELNFTIDYYLRKDRKWSNVIEYSNGTFGGDGIVPDVFFKRADLIVGTLSITPHRYPYIDYLPPSEYYPGCNRSCLV